MSDGLRRDFFKGAKDEKAVITQFTGLNADSALKTKPKVSTSSYFSGCTCCTWCYVDGSNRQLQGYDADHKDIKLLRLKSFTLSTKLGDSDITGADSLQRIADLIGSMVPLVRIYLDRLSF